MSVLIRPRAPSNVYVTGSLLLQQKNNDIASDVRALQEQNRNL